MLKIKRIKFADNVEIDSSPKDVKVCWSFTPPSANKGAGHASALVKGLESTQTLSQDTPIVIRRDALNDRTTSLRKRKSTGDMPGRLKPRQLYKDSSEFVPEDLMRTLQDLVQSKQKLLIPSSGILEFGRLHCDLATTTILNLPRMVTTDNPETAGESSAAPIDLCTDTNAPNCVDGISCSPLPIEPDPFSDDDFLLAVTQLADEVEALAGDQAEPNCTKSPNFTNHSHSVSVPPPTYDTSCAPRPFTASQDCTQPPKCMAVRPPPSAALLSSRHESQAASLNPSTAAGSATAKLDSGISSSFTFIYDDDDDLLADGAVLQFANRIESQYSNK